MGAALKIRLFGRPAIVGIGGNAIPGLPKKAFLATAVVALATTRRCAKAELAEILWPNLAGGHRANNLRQLLFRVRHFEVAHDWTLFEASEHEIALADGVACDLVEFETAAGDILGAGPEQLLGIYGGRLLDDHRNDGQSPHRWLSDRRLQLEDLFVDLLLAAIEDMPSHARRAALNQAIRVAPTALGPRKALMRQLITDGSTQEARRQFREIQHIGGHGSVAVPVELVAELLPAQARIERHPTVPLSQAGRDQAGVPHLALLPPRAGAGTRDELMMAEGLIDDVTVALTRLRSLSILAPHSARKIVSGEDHDGTGLARADFVLRTKLASGASRSVAAPQMTLLLERAASRDIVWADSLTLENQAGPMQFAAIANGIALTLVDQIERATLRAFQVPADAGAYGHYLLGLNALQVLDLPSTRRARASFKSAMALSPIFAPAHTGFAQSMIYEWIMRGQGEVDLLTRARRAAERARDIDPLFGSAHQMLGRASLFEGDFTASLSHFEQAEALNPHHADLLCDFADTLMHSSLAERANDKIELALRLNPLAPDAYWWASAGIKFFVGEYDGALGHLGRIRNKEPVLRLTAACAAMAGQPDLAKQARERFLAIDPGFRLDEWIGVLPVRDPVHRRQYRHALQKAGFK
jgi:DNA-binding SARP family transcriptional activator/tetratricopeptide (TPR) repeat protein